MIVGGQTEARAQLSSTIIDYHEPFDQGLKQIDPLDQSRAETKMLKYFLDKCPFNGIEGFVNKEKYPGNILCFCV